MTVIHDIVEIADRRDWYGLIDNSGTDAYA